MRKITVILVMMSVFLLLLPCAALAAVQKVTLSVYPLTPGTASQYTIGFYVSNSGELKGGDDRIRIVFPEGTTIPSSIDSNKILINGNSLSSSYIYVADNILTLRLPGNTNIDDGGYVGVVIPDTAGITTPLRGGNYYLLVGTTNDGEAQSNSISIQGSRVDDLELSVSPPTVDEYAEYEITFEASSKGDLAGGEDYIYIELPDEAYLPASIAGSSIRINGEKPASNGVKVNRSTNTIAIQVPSGLNISSRSVVTVQLDSSAGIRNPEDSGKYELGVYTSKDSLLVETMYSVGLSISSPVVTVSPADGGINSQYAIGFTTSSVGTLKSGEDYIYLYFPEGTYVPGSINNSYVSVNGYNARSVSGSRSEREMAIRMPSQVNVQKNSFVQIVVSNSAGLRNPGTDGQYRLEVATSADKGKVKSREYTITGNTASSGRPAVYLSTDVVGECSEITIEFKLAAGRELERGYDEIIVVFPDEFSLPSTVRTSDITINGDRINDYEINDDELVLTVPADLEGGDDIEIVIESSAGIRNPASSGSYQLETYTSQDSRKAKSNGFNIWSESARPLPQVELSSYLPEQTAEWLLAIFAWKDWDLEDTDTISITFPSGTTVPYSIPNDFIEINDLAAKYVLVSGRELTIGLPADLEIEDGDKVLVRILAAGGIQNPAVSGNYKIEVVTPEKDDPYESTAYRIGTGSVTGTGKQIIFRIGSKLASDDGVLINLDTAPTIIEDFTVVPLRALGDALGAETSYNGEFRSVTVTYNNKALVFYIDSKMVKMDDQWVMADIPATLLNDRVMIPARFVSQSYGANVDWNGDTQEVIITK